MDEIDEYMNNKSGMDDLITGKVMSVAWAEHGTAQGASGVNTWGEAVFYFHGMQWFRL